MIKLTDAELDAVAADQNTFTNDGGNYGIQQFFSGNNNSGGNIIIYNDTVIIDQLDNNRIAIEVIEGTVIGDINISDSEDSIVVNTASQDLIIGNTAFNFDDSGYHMELTGFNGAGVDGGHVITFQGGANDVAVAEHDGHTTLSWAGGDCTLTVDAVDLTKADWFFA